MQSFRQDGMFQGIYHEKQKHSPDFHLVVSLSIVTDFSPFVGLLILQAAAASSTEWR